MYGPRGPCARLTGFEYQPRFRKQQTRVRSGIAMTGMKASGIDGKLFYRLTTTRRTPVLHPELCQRSCARKNRFARLSALQPLTQPRRINRCIDEITQRVLPVAGARGGIVEIVRVGNIDGRDTRRQQCLLATTLCCVRPAPPIPQTAKRESRNREDSCLRQRLSGWIVWHADSH